MTPTCADPTISSATRPAATVPLHRRRRLAVALTLLVGLLAPMLTHAASADAAVRARTATESSIAKSVLNLLNQERAKNRLPALTSNGRLQSAARAHNAAMAKANLLSHQLPGEKSLGQRLDAVGYHWTWCGENVGWTTSLDNAGALGIQTSMYNEKAPKNGHRLNILNRSARNVGIDIYISGNKLWFTTDFGRL